MKVAIISNNTSDIVNKRGLLIKSIINNGHEVVAIGNEDINEKKIKELGAKVINVSFNNISTNLFKIIDYTSKIKKILLEEKIDVVLAYTPKPIICGSIAAKQAGVPYIYTLFAGLGYHYSINTIRTIFIRFFCNIGYRIACKIDTSVIFQNKEDRDELIKKRFVSEEKAYVVDGSGVDLNIFKKAENRICNTNKMKFLMISRGLNVKGIRELSIAAENIHKNYPNIEFVHIGKIDNNYREITKEEKKLYSKNINFLGKKDNVYDYIKKTNVVILPSYLREGIPRVLLEALAVGRPIITTNTRGCKETVIDGKNGFLVNPKDPIDLEKKIYKIIGLSIKEIIEMSENSYQLAKERFDIHIINKKMIEIMKL